MKYNIQFRTSFCSYPIIHACWIPLIFVLSGCNSNPERRPSPLRSDSTYINGVNAYIEFSSPGVKDRQIFGNGPDYLVPYDEMWRTGANDATFVAIDGQIQVDTNTLDSGRYSIFTIPNDEEWTVIFNKEWEQWGSYNYKDSLDVFRIKVRPQYADQSQERMLFYFADDSLKFRWDKVRWAIPFTNR